MSSENVDKVMPEGQQPEGGEPVAKSKNQLKNEAKKAEKMAKFMAKQANATASAEKTAAKPKTLNVVSAPVAEDKTVPGEKKDLSAPMADAYSPKAVEAAWYAWWEKSGFFKPEVNEGGEVFTMVMPPPNVTGSLHLGHAMMASIEDALSRWHRMNGKQVLYLPGCDHAGIATQAVVEKKLKREQDVTRHDLGREAFVQEIWKWKVQYGDQIYHQLRRMGVSADWERACFTLDPAANRAVVEAFCRMFEDGLIFRANRLVHWSGKLKTALSDLEVDMKEIAPNTWLPAFGHDPKRKYEFGVMTAIAYRVEGSEDEIVIQTTRPETVFADTAVAVHPADERYKRFHGKSVVHPVMGTLLPVICDEAADMGLGTGALKVSPAHDATDFALGQKHGLRFVSVFDEDNVLNANAGAFAGMKRFDARDAVIEHIKRNGTFRGQTPHAMSLPFCSRSGDIVEPRMIPQWWCDCREMARRSCEAVRSGELQILPKEHEKTWFYWLENIRDWCLSRQLWWGHRIPAYQVCGLGSSEEVWVVGRTYEEALRRAQAKFPDLSPDRIILEQDHDVLDTWFSSGLWPFSTLGWPDASADMAKHFPNSLLETGGDILFFWVARMAMMSIYLTGRVPFSRVFLHAMVRDAHGRKMSKSLGNVIDPLDVIEGVTLADLQARLDAGNLDPAEVKTAKEGQRRDFPAGIPECGTDALRIALCSYVAQGRDVNLNINKVDAFRRFGNKLWNACRFAMMKLGDGFTPSEHLSLSGSESLADLWILSKLREAITETNTSFHEYNLMQAVSAVHSFWLYDLCDVYIEVTKPVFAPENTDAASRATAQNVLYTCLETGLRLLHPFMPFVTEELYQRLPRRSTKGPESIMIAPYPKAHDIPVASEQSAEFERVHVIAKSIRSFAAENKLAPRTAAFSITSADAATMRFLAVQEHAISALTRAVGCLSVRSSETELEAEDGKEVMHCSLSEDISVAFIVPKKQHQN